MCRHGETAGGETTVTLERGGLTLVLKRVPARVCRNCGEAYLDAAVADHLLQTADASARAGVQLEVRHYTAAQEEPGARTGDTS